MTEKRLRYDTPHAFRSALKGRFAQIAREDKRYTLDELQRQFAYDRALARLFSSDDASRWVLKGAGALLARLSTARHSKDVDMLFHVADAEVDDAVDALLAALRIDLNDHFTFDVTRIGALQEEAKGARVHVDARLGPAIFAAFHVDVVVATAMTGTPDVVPPLTPLDIEGLIRPHYRVFPVSDHLADKLCATVGIYTRGGRAAQSTRVKDLVDIALIASTHSVSARTLRIAITANAALRGIELPRQFAVPDPPGWASRYPRVAAEAPGPVVDYEAAVALAARLFDPVLQESVAGLWDPRGQAWV